MKAVVPENISIGSIVYNSKTLYPPVANKVPNKTLQSSSQLIPS